MYVFDWYKAAAIIAAEKPELVEAGLRDDWSATGGTIYTASEGIVLDTYTYLASLHAIPEIMVDGEIRPCYLQVGPDHPWDAKTKWPAEALASIS